MNLPGMFVENKTVGAQTYQRLMLPECGVTGEIGSPEFSFCNLRNNSKFSIPLCHVITQNCFNEEKIAFY
jgi:hypothetical protein